MRKIKYLLHPVPHSSVILGTEKSIFEYHEQVQASCDRHEGKITGVLLFQKDVPFQ